MDRLRLRLLDANFNRAREALRVLEDYARFILNDGPLSRSAKTMRHDLSRIVSGLGGEALAVSRDTPHDVGTQISTASERRRADALAVIQAAAKRLTEALRCLEEYGKIDSADLGSELEALRYRAYELERQILLRANVSARLADIRLYVLLTEELCSGPILEVARAVLAGGADCIQLRQKDVPDAELLRLATAVSELCHQAGAMFIVNDRPDLAVLADADGVHLGQGDLPVSEARRVMGARMVAGRSTHSLQEAQAAIKEGADYIAVGSIYPSRTKPGVAAAGTKLLQQIRDICERPIIAIGGINTDNAHAALTAGATAVAVCQAVIADAQPGEAARRIKQGLLAARNS